jgi:hypothetical protein
MRGAPSSVQSTRTYNYPRVENDSANRWLRDAMLHLFGDYKRRT